MRKRGVFVSTSVAALLGAGAASAHMPSSATGWYLGLEGGANFIADAALSTDDIDPAFGPGTYNFAGTTFKTGWAVLGTGGYDFGWFRWDILEVGYRNNSFNTFYTNGSASDFTTGFAFGGGGNFDELSFMTNAILELDLPPSWTLSVGAGAGADWVFNYDNNAGFHTLPTLHDEDWAFAWQILGGVTKHFSAFDVFVNYRYFTVQSPTFIELDGFGFLHDDSYGDVHKHTVTLGVRMVF